MHKFNPKYLFIVPFLLLFGCYGQNSRPNFYNGNMQNVDHTAWDILLKKYVDDKGNVNYKEWKTEKGELIDYLDYLAKNPISNTAEKEEQLAYYINLYNAGTVQLILENYPLKSIKNIFRPWGKDRLMIGDDNYSLSEIEHGILRRMNEPRIHFAINCASFSCPKLINEAYVASKMDEQLEAATFQFINDSTKNNITGNSVQLSRIFKWYKGDFDQQKSLVDYLNVYSNIKIKLDAEIDFLTYDWSLNEK